MHIIGAPSSFESYGSRSIKIHFFWSGGLRKIPGDYDHSPPNSSRFNMDYCRFFRTPATNIKLNIPLNGISLLLKSHEADILQMCHVSVYTIFHYCLFCGSICNISVLVTCRRVNCFAFWMKRTCGIVQNSPITMIYYIIFHKSSLIVIADNEAIFVAKFLSMKPTHASVRRSYTISLCLFSRFYFSFYFHFCCFLYSFGRIVTVD